jgi:hypothetical protein
MSARRFGFDCCRHSVSKLPHPSSAMQMAIKPLSTGIASLALLRLQCAHSCQARSLYGALTSHTPLSDTPPPTRPRPHSKPHCANRMDMTAGN